MASSRARTWRLAIAAAAWLGAAENGFAQPPATPTFANVSVHDPSIVRDGSTFYVFGSHLASASSTDLMHWTQISTAAVAGNPLAPNPQAEFQAALAWAQTNDFWAPDCIKLSDGKYHFYYCMCRGDAPISALGVATADAITGAYHNDTILLESGMYGQLSPDGKLYDNAIHPNTVDPSVFFDANGKYWMVYGSFSGGIFIIALDPTTGHLVPGQGYGRKLIGGNNARIEGPYIIYSPETAYYYLFFTFGGLDSHGGYNIREGRSRNPDGPYLDAAGNDLTNVKGAAGTLFDDVSIAPYGVKVMGNWQFLHAAADAGSISRGYVSPGGTSVYRDPATSQYLMVFHTRFVGMGEYHEVRVHPVYLNEDGWFVAAPQRYAGERVATADPNQVPGDYKLINHGKDITATVKTSTAITLNPDGTITGTSTGTWSVSGDHNIELTLGGAAFHGVVTTQWDDDNQRWVLTFSALSTDGVSIWGSKVAAVPVNAAPVITRNPVSQTVWPAQAATLSVGDTATPAPAYQWFRNTVAIAGATNSSYAITATTANDIGTYTVTVTNAAGSVTSAAAILSFPQPPAQVTVPPGDATTQIVNLSTRGIVSTGDSSLIAGFAISGPASKKLLIQVSGLTLRKYGLSGEIGRPHIMLTHHVNNADVTLAENSDWQTAQAAISALEPQVGALTLTPSTDSAHGDAGFIVTLPAGSYTAVVTPDAQSATTDGIGLVEIYDATPTDGSRLVNISTRGRIEPGARQMIVGLYVAGSGQSRLMIRGVGPTLGAFGVAGTLSNPSVTLYQNVNGTQTSLATNDDWWNSAQSDQIGVTAPKVGAFDLRPYSSDAVLFTRITPGQYSAIISPSDTIPGIALAEIYEANTP